MKVEVEEVVENGIVVKVEVGGGRRKMSHNFKRKVFHIIIYSEIYKKLKYFYKRDK